jgi:hypothetical protein
LPRVSIRARVSCGFVLAVFRWNNPLHQVKVNPLVEVAAAGTIVARVPEVVDMLELTKTKFVFNTHGILFK